MAAVAGIVVAALIIALTVFLLTRGGDGVEAEDASITLTEILNKVETDVGDEQFALASVGQALETGDGVKTFPDSQARVDLAVRDFKRVVRTTPNTVWRLGQFGVDKDTIIEMDSGKVFMWDSGEADGSPAVKVQTPAGVAAVRGTWMSVTFDDASGLLELDCYRGSCELSNDLGSTLLTDQQKSQTTATTVPTPAVPMEQSELDEWKQLPEVLRGALIIPEVAGTATPSPSSSDLPDVGGAACFDTVQGLSEINAWEGVATLTFEASASEPRSTGSSRTASESHTWETRFRVERGDTPPIRDVDGNLLQVSYNQVDVSGQADIRGVIGDTSAAASGDIARGDANLRVLVQECAFRLSVNVSIDGVHSPSGNPWTSMGGRVNLDSALPTGAGSSGLVVARGSKRVTAHTPGPQVAAEDVYLILGYGSSEVGRMMGTQDIGFAQVTWSLWPEGMEPPEEQLPESPFPPS
jgi:hypothetical protein